MKNEIAAFIKEQMHIYRQTCAGSKGHLRFQLYHIGMFKGQGKLETVSSFDLDPAANLSDLSTRIFKMSEADAEDYAGGPQKYQLNAEAHLQSKSDDDEDVEEPDEDEEVVDVKIKVLGRFKWRVSASESETDMAGPSEPATDDGQIAQQMRHVEYMVKRVAKSADALEPVIRAYQKELERKDAQADKYIARIEFLEAKQHASIELREQLATREHERAIELEEFRGSQEFRARGMQMLAPLVPMLLAKFTGQSGSGPMMGALNGFLDTIDEPQFMELQKVFRPEQLATLMMIWEETKKTAKKEAADQQQQPH